MQCNSLRIRAAKVEDAPALLAIYAPYVRETAITFEYDVPTPDAFAGRVRDTLARYPYIVAELAGTIVGYAYLSPFKERAAYDWSAETSIYVADAYKRQGVGAALYHALEQCAAAQGLLNLNACIASPEREDERLTHDSERFHEALGYRLVGEFRACGYKFGRWYNMVWMEKHLGEHPLDPAPVKPFGEALDDLIRAGALAG